MQPTPLDRSLPVLVSFCCLSLLVLTLSQLPSTPALLRSSHQPPPASLTPPSRDMPPLVVGTLNLRYDGGWRDTVPVGQKGDESEGTHPSIGDGYGEKPWSQRRWRVLSQLQFSSLCLIGFQEALHNQVSDLASLLGPSWSHVGVGRDDGRTAGEYSPIFYDNTRFERLSWDTAWLSQDPSKVGSVGWDASQTRIVTLLSLRERSTGQVIHAANTHWDDQGLRARAESGRLLRKLVPERALRVEKTLGLGDGKELAGLVILIGDLNSPVSEAGYQLLTQPSEATDSSEDQSVTLAPSSPAFLDAMHLLPLHRSPSSSLEEPMRPHLPFGPILTYTGFNRFDRGTRIDFVFLFAKSQDDGWGVRRYGVEENFVDGDAQGWKGQISDHRLVVAELVKT